MPSAPWSAAADKRSSESDSRMPVIPSSARTPLVVMPCDSTPDSPLMNASSAIAGSLFQAAENCSADMPDTCANRDSDSPPSSTALPMRFIVCDMAEPPASASMPTEDMAVAMPITSPSVRPA